MVAQPRAARTVTHHDATIRMRTGDFDTRRASSLLDGTRRVFEVGRPHVVQLTGPLTPARKTALERIGVELGPYLPLNAYLCQLGATAGEDLAALDFVRWVGTYRKTWKRDPEIGHRAPFGPGPRYQTRHRRDLAAAGRVQLVAVLFPGEDLMAAVGQLGIMPGARITGANQVGSQGMIDLNLSLHRLDALVARPEVRFVEEAPEATPRNDTTRWIVQSNISGQTPVYDRGIRGEGMIGGLIDGLLAEDHCLFLDAVNPIGPTHRKLEAYHGNTAGMADPHGTHTSGTFVGAAEGGHQYDGMAYEARLVFTDGGTIFISSSTSLNNAFVTAHNEGARVHSNSWGADGRTDYNNWSMQIDQFTYDNEESMVAFAITNATNALYTPENAKNVLAVAASKDTPLQDKHCMGGIGPTADGRRKPEVYAPGCSTWSSVASPCSFASVGWTGTSMACPAVSGMGLLARQYFVDGWYPTGSAAPGNALTPSGALLRAVLINSAVDMSGMAGYPGNREGWGRVLLDNALYFTQETRKLQVVDVRNVNGLSTGGSASYNVTVNDAAEVLRVTLVWTGPPALVGAADPVINNLDLVVTAPSATVYLGNDFSGGVSTNGGVADTKNNVEQVHLPAPEIGTYAVRVDGTAVNQGTQGYALVITGGLFTGVAGDGDIDNDGDVDIEDYGLFQMCFGQSPVAPQCVDADMQPDDAIDLADYTLFNAALTGARSSGP